MFDFIGERTEESYDAEMMCHVGLCRGHQVKPITENVFLYRFRASVPDMSGSVL